MMVRAHVVRWGVVALVGLFSAACSLAPVEGGRSRPLPPLGHEGRWFTDATGRVVMLRGVNFVEKWAPFTPAADGFDDDDAALLASSGFNTVRLGVVFEFLMPEPGSIDRGVPRSIAETVRILGRHGIYVLLDFHQDGWGPVTHGNGMPAWATITDGLPNPPAPFPLYYVQNPALQRAFDNFWANRPGPDGVPLQEHYATAMRAVAQRFASSLNVIGYEAMNEPWPGDELVALLERLSRPRAAAARAVLRADDGGGARGRSSPSASSSSRSCLFNFGGTDTSLPGAGSANALSTHVYALERRSRRVGDGSQRRRGRATTASRCSSPNGAPSTIRRSLIRDGRPVRRTARAVAVLVVQRPHRHRQSSSAGFRQPQ